MWLTKSARRRSDPLFLLLLVDELEIGADLGRVGVGSGETGRVRTPRPQESLSLGGCQGGTLRESLVQVPGDGYLQSQ